MSNNNQLVGAITEALLDEEVNEIFQSTMDALNGKLSNVLAHSIVDHGNKIGVMLTESGMVKLGLDKGSSRLIELTSTNNQGFDINLASGIIAMDISIGGVGGTRTLDRNHYDHVLFTFVSEEGVIQSSHLAFLVKEIGMSGLATFINKYDTMANIVRPKVVSRGGKSNVVNLFGPRQLH